MPDLVAQLRSAADRTYLLAFSYRSGSTLVSSDLARAGVGRPTEYFQALRYEGRGGSLADYVVRTVSASSVDGLFGCKISWEQAASLVRRLVEERAVPPGTTINDLFPDVRFLHLVRRDVLAQAVSCWRAHATGEWHRRSGTPAPDRPIPPFDVVAAADRYLQVTAETNLWNEWFRRAGVEPHRLTYERWCEDRAGSVAGVAELLGVVLDLPVPVEDELEVLRDDWSAAACDRLWNYLAAPSSSDWVGARSGAGRTAPAGLPCPP